MRKTKIVFAMLLMLLLCSPSFADVGVKVDGVNKGIATDLDFTGAGTSVSVDGSRLLFNLVLSGFGTSGAVSMTTDQTIVLSSYSYIRKRIADSTSSPSYNTGTLDNGKPGRMITIYITDVDSGTGTFTMTPLLSTVFSSILFNAAEDWVTLLYINDTTGWVPIATNSVQIVFKP